MWYQEVPVVGSPRTRTEVVSRSTCGWKSANKNGYESKCSFYLWLSPQTRLMWYQEVPVVRVREQVYRIKTGMEREREHSGVLEHVQTLAVCCNV